MDGRSRRGGRRAGTGTGVGGRVGRGGLEIGRRNDASGGGSREDFGGRQEELRSDLGDSGWGGRVYQPTEKVRNDTKRRRTVLGKSEGRPGADDRS